MIVSIGVVGAGNFAQFASEAFLRTGKVKMVAFMDIDMKAAAQMAGKFQGPVNFETIVSETKGSLFAARFSLGK